MTDVDMTTDRFVEMVLAGGGREQALADALASRAGDTDARYRMAAQCLYVAVVAPELVVDVYDGLTEGWLGAAPDGPRITAPLPGTSEEISDELWAGLWPLVFDPDAGRDPALITVRTAALTEHLTPELNRRTAAMAMLYPGVAEAAAGGIPDRFKLEDLAACPKDSLGGALYSFVIDKGFDLEVLDRDALGLQELPPPLDYLNVRILQCHDIWHLVAGHETSGLHEVSVTGFQMAQFGHQYSAMFLGMLLTKMAFTQAPEVTGFTLDTILTGYRHGRETPALMGVEWETIWDQPIAQIRTELGVTAYDSPYPAWVMEDMRALEDQQA